MPGKPGLQGTKGDKGSIGHTGQILACVFTFILFVYNTRYSTLYMLLFHVSSHCGVYVCCTGQPGRPGEKGTPGLSGSAGEPGHDGRPGK